MPASRLLVLGQHLLSLVHYPAPPAPAVWSVFNVIALLLSSVNHFALDINFVSFYFSYRGESFLCLGFFPWDYSEVLAVIISQRIFWYDRCRPTIEQVRGHRSADRIDQQYI